MKSPISNSAIFAVPVASSPHVDVRVFDDAPTTEYVQLAEQALFVVLLSGVAVMAGSFAMQILSSHL